MTIELPTNDVAPAASKGVDRRTLLKAGAWAAPVVLLTTAVPAATASDGVITVTLSAVAATGPGSANRYNIFLNLTSTYATDQSVSITWETLPTGLSWELGPQTTATVPANTDVATAVSIGRVHATGANGTSYTIDGEVTLPGDGTVPISTSVTK